jgi:uncharacterized protein (TIGR00299 family) protein
MRIAYLECYSGISGDMLLGALADAGAPAAELQAVPERLGLAGASLCLTRTERMHIAASQARVEGADSASHPHRSLADIRGVIQGARLAPRACQLAIAVFQRLAEVEARIHDVPVERVHFHEVGAVDSLIDIVGACVGLELLGIEKLYCSPLNVGGGTARTAHGELPAPAPATVELLKAACAPVYSSGVQAELVTPTGAALVATLVSGFGAVPPMKLLAAGYGAGAKDFADRANVLRILVGEGPGTMEQACVGRMESAAPAASVCLIEANIDDMSPQIAGHLAEQALAAGALDVYFTPVQMKKNRAGTLVTLVVEPADRERLARLLFAESTTIGVRFLAAERRALDRAQVPVQTDYGPVRVKVSRLEGEVLNFAPEYEDCLKIARERGVPLKTVLAEASRRYLEQYGEGER